MFGECHAHMLMDGIDYREAVNAAQRMLYVSQKVREYFEAYQKSMGFLLYVTEEITAEFPEEPAQNCRRIWDRLSDTGFCYP